MVGLRRTSTGAIEQEQQGSVTTAEETATEATTTAAGVSSNLGYWRGSGPRGTGAVGHSRSSSRERSRSKARRVETVTAAAGVLSKQGKLEYHYARGLAAAAAAGAAAGVLSNQGKLGYGCDRNSRSSSRSKTGAGQELTQ